MLRAFRELDYDVFIISGNSSERRRAMNALAEQLRRGIQFDFAYSESSTMPTALTGRHHLPIHPFLDYSFFRICKENRIPLGLFYRDIYWRFPDYVRSVGVLKAAFAKLFYRLDLLQYEKYLCILYVPTMAFAEEVGSKLLLARSQPLPPGAPQMCTTIGTSVGGQSQLRLLYVGGVSDQYYDIGLVIDTVLASCGVNLTICTRENEWREYSDGKPARWHHPRISVVHASGAELEPLYQAADVGLLVLRPDPYRSIAAPVKLMEYLGHGLPTIGVNGTAAGDIINSLQIGWTVDYNDLCLSSLLATLKTDREALATARAGCHDALGSNTWKARATQVAEELTGQHLSDL